MGPDRMEPDSVGVDGQSDADIRVILETTRRIALVGASARPWRPSHGVMRFLLECGYDVSPVNPGAGRSDDP
jgi:predicted CoA-binding protein